MKIREFFISGFGIFSGLRVDNLSSGLNVFVGDNEAGKSTLLGFFRAVFFGFDKNKNPYKPVADVEHGGVIKLTLDRSGLEYTIRRRPGNKRGLVEVTLPDGGIAGEEVIEQLLPGMSADLHKNVFAFGLDELQDVKSLDAKELRSRIYSFGAGAGQVSAVDVERRLEDDMSALFLPRASTKKINTVLSALDASHSRIKELQVISSDYNNTCSSLTDQVENIEKAGISLKEAKQEVDHLERMEKAWPSWESIYQAEASLTRIPRVDSFPSDGIVRLERCLEKTAVCSREIERRHAELAEHERNKPVLQAQRQSSPRLLTVAGVTAGGCLIALSVAFRQNIIAAAAFGLLGLVTALSGLRAQSYLDSTEKARREESFDQLSQSWLLTKKRISEDIRAYEDQLEQSSSEHKALLSAGGASNDEDFRDRWDHYLKREQLKDDIARRHANIELIAGTDVESFTSELASADLASIRSRLLDKRSEARALEARIADMNEQKGRLVQKKEEMERSEELSAELLKERTLRARLNELASDWAVKAICKFLLAQTRQKYEREKQPRVIQSASNYLSEFTSGAYARVFSPLGSEEVELETPEGIRKDVAKLSRGTREQLYLALRFGLVKEYGLAAETLPVIMDDILVNFDPARTRAAARAIIELSKSNQVLFFTCHPEVADVFAEMDESILRLKLPNGLI